MRPYLIFSALVFLVFLASWTTATDVSSCSTLSSAGIYTLTANLYIANNKCVIISSPNVLLDCDGYTISGNSFSSETGNVGVFVSSENNVTIRNCRIQNYSSAILVSQSSNVTIYNNTLFNNTHHGIRIDTVPNNDTRIFNNTFSYNSQTGMQANANSSQVYNNLFFNQSSFQIRFLGGVYNNVTNNTIWNGSNVGIRIDGYTNDSYIFNNTIFNQSAGSGSGINLVSSFRAFIHNNTIYNNSQYGVYLQSGAYNNVSNNSISNHSSKAAVRADGSENFTRVESNVLYNNAGGVHVLWGINFTIRNNTVTFSSDNGVLLQSFSHNNTVANNTFRNFTASAVKLTDSSNESRIFSNTFSDNPSASAIDIRVLSGRNTAYLNNVSFIYGSSNGILLNNASYNNASYNRILNLSGSAIKLTTDANYNNVTDNTVINVSGSGERGILINTNSDFNLVARNSLNDTSGGGILLTGTINNTILNNTVYFTAGTGIQLEINTTNATIQGNTVVNHTSSGVLLSSYSQRNYVLNNTIFNGTYQQGSGIQINGESFLNWIDYNNVSLSHSDKLVVSNASNNTVRFNRFTNLTTSGSHLVTLGTLSRYNLFQFNTLENTTTSGRGFSITNSTFNTFENNTVRYSEQVSLTAYANNNTFNGNHFEGGYNYGLHLDGQSSNNTFRDTNITFRGGAPLHGIFIQQNSNDNWFENTSVLNYPEDGVRVDGSLRNTFVGGIISGNAGTLGNQTRFQNASTGNQLANVSISGGASHVSVNGSSSVTIVNATFNESLVRGELGAFNITLRWYFTVRALDFDGDGLQSINVTVTNNTPAVDQFGATNLSSSTVFGGFSYYQLVSEAFINSTGTTNTSAYNVTISRANPYNASQTRYNSTLVNITSQDQTVTLQSNALPNVTLSSPASGNRNTSRNVTVAFLPLDPDSPVFSNCSVFTNETAFTAKNTNATAITNGSANTMLMNFSSDGDFVWNVQCYDNAREASFATANFTISIDNTTPTSLAYASPTLSNGSVSLNNFTEVNVTFTEANPDSCILEFDNGTKTNFSMTRSGTSCYRNHSIVENGFFNYTVYVNDSFGHWNNSERRFVTMAAAPTVTLSSPASGNRNTSRNVTVVYVPLDWDSTIFSNCSVFTNETSFTAKNYNATAITNGSSNSMLMNLSSDGDFVWNVQCYDNTGVSSFATANNTISIDNVTPASFAYASPTLSNGSTTTVNYTEVNVTFSEANPDSCILEFDNGTKTNFSMTRSGTSCYRNHSIVENGFFNYTVYVNDSFGHWNNSERRFITFSDDITPPTVTLAAPAHASTLTSAPSFVYSFIDDVSSTARCDLFVDNVHTGTNSTTANNTATTLSSNASISAAPHNWQVKCTDSAGNQGNSSLFEFALSSGSNTPPVVPTTQPAPTVAPPAPTPLPGPTVAPAPTLAPTIKPTVAPEPTVEPEPSKEPEPITKEEFVVTLEEPAEQAPQTTESETSTTQDLPPAKAPTIEITHTLEVTEQTQPSGVTTVASTVGVGVYNPTDKTLVNVQVEQRFPFIECLGSDPQAYAAVGIIFNPRPANIRCGSAVVTWLFDNVEPGQTAKAEVVVPKKLEQKDVKSITTPKVIAKAARASSAQQKTQPAATTSVKQDTPKPGGFDWTLPAIGVLAILAAAAFFLTRKKHEGL